MARTPGLLTVTQAEQLGASRGDWERDPTAPRTSNIYRLRNRHTTRISYRTFIALYRKQVFGLWTERKFKTWKQAFAFIKRLSPRDRVYVLAFGTNVDYQNTGVQWWTVMKNTERQEIQDVAQAQRSAASQISAFGTAERNPIAVRYHA